MFKMFYYVVGLSAKLNFRCVALLYCWVFIGTFKSHEDART